jgi:hypothetical protein
MVSAMVQSSDNLSDGYFSVRGNSSSQVLNQIAFGAVGSNWKRLAFEFDTGNDGAVLLYLGLWGHAAGTWLRVDNVTMYAQTPNQVRNGSFEDGNSAWFLDPPTQRIGSATQHTGANGLVLGGSVGRNEAWQWIQVKPNTRYHASAWVRTSPDSGFRTFRVLGTDAANNPAQVLKQVPFGPSGDWQLLSFDIASGVNTNLGIDFFYSPTGTDTTVEVDDVSVSDWDGPPIGSEGVLEMGIGTGHDALLLGPSSSNSVYDWGIIHRRTDQEVKGAAIAMTATDANHFGMQYAFFNDTSFWFWGDNATSSVDLNATLGDPGQVQKVLFCPFASAAPSALRDAMHVMVLAKIRKPNCGRGNCRRDALLHTIRHSNGTWDPWSNDIRDIADDHGPVTDIACDWYGNQTDFFITTGAGGLYHTAIDNLSNQWSKFEDFTQHVGNRGFFTHVATAGQQLLASTSDGGLWHTIRFDQLNWQNFGDVQGQTGRLEDGAIVSLAADMWLNYLSANPYAAHFVVIKASGTPWLTTRYASDGRWDPFRNEASYRGLPNNFLQWLFAYYFDPGRIG